MFPHLFSGMRRTSISTIAIRPAMQDRRAVDVALYPGLPVCMDLFNDDGIDRRPASEVWSPFALVPPRPSLPYDDLH
ncbi:hypothetical protein SCP_0702290 [Sparassis crispa]|uniref:Uncharacterized protein n=1 Tax=Sparassis crispa TaxID=139825 RepID=A0A401GS65_9APHY|nr:hypothetical protein SCP_0702290 [Sparassis crispa]GBE85043.1 hypothetical protein SCP_0702290 [Sparassis crispa]